MVLQGVSKTAAYNFFAIFTPFLVVRSLNLLSQFCFPVQGASLAGAEGQIFDTFLFDLSFFPKMVKILVLGYQSCILQPIFNVSQ